MRQTCNISQYPRYLISWSLDGRSYRPLLKHALRRHLQYNLQKEQEF